MNEIVRNYWYIAIPVALFIYLNIGYWYGRLAHYVLKSNCWRWIKLLFAPNRWLGDELNLEYYRLEESYPYISSIFWPLQIFCCFVLACFSVVVKVIAHVGIYFWDLITDEGWQKFIFPLSSKSTKENIEDAQLSDPSDSADLNDIEAGISNVIETLNKNKQDIERLKKYIWILIIILLLSLIGNIYQAKAQDSTAYPNVRIAKTYVGVVGVGVVDTSYRFKNSSTAMVAFASEARLSQDFRLNVNLVSLDNFSQTVGHYFLQYGSEKSTLMVKAGQLSRLISFHRPNPVSPGMHFEPASKGIIPGAVLGGATWFNYGSGQLAGGLYRAKSLTGANVIEYNGAWIQKLGAFDLRLSGYYSQIGQGLALTGKFQGTELTAYTDKDSLASTFVNLSSTTVGWKVGDLYLDQIYDFKHGRFNRLEIGWYDIYNVNITGVQGNICLGFGWRQYPERSFRLYVWSYIFREGGVR